MNNEEYQLPREAKATADAFALTLFDLYDEMPPLDAIECAERLIRQKDFEKHTEDKMIQYLENRLVEYYCYGGIK